MSELLTCEGLTKHYGAKTALDGVDLHIGFGKIVGLLGPNGSGNLWLVLLVTILIGAVYFVLTSWLMKNKLDLE